MATALATFDSRPFFDKTLRYGVQQGLITPERLLGIQTDFSKGIVQIANFFGTAHLRPELELALRRMVNLVSLYLEDMSGGDLKIAAASLRDKTLLSHSKAGSDMLKRLHAMPEDKKIGSSPLPGSQHADLDNETASDTIPLAKYLSELAKRQENQNTIDFALWLAKKMGDSREDLDSLSRGATEADSLIHSAMLVIFVDKAELKLPTRTAFVRLFKSAKNPKAKLKQDRLEAFLREAPTEFQQLARHAMGRFIETDLPQIQAYSKTVDKFLNGVLCENYFVAESADDDVREYDGLVAEEWDRVTQGEADDPAVMAKVCFFVATGFPPKKDPMLLREAREIIRVFRTSGFDSRAVIQFIDKHAPEAIREELQKSWTYELKPEAEEQLSDLDPNWPDTHMERALKYLRETCRVAWKGRRR